jgi:serine protease Do
MKVGQDVVAIGNPLGELGGTVTNGIISALDRQVIVDGHPMTLLQTNAAINPGNSGGGLFNMAGELIGIVNAKQSETGIEGLGFAIPIDVAWKKASDLMQYGYVTGKILLEFSVEAKTSEFYVQDGGGFFAKTYTFPAGVYVMSSENGSLKKYDRLMSVNGITVNSISDFYQAIQGLVKGDEMKLVISRLDTSGVTAQFREHTVTMTVKVTEPTAKPQQ